MSGTGRIQVQSSVQKFQASYSGSFILPLIFASANVRLIYFLAKSKSKYTVNIAHLFFPRFVRITLEKRDISRSNKNRKSRRVQEV